jgi:serine/threonine-protein kinase
VLTCPESILFYTVQNPAIRELKHSKYRLLGLVGQGQFGRVYCAVHRQTGQLVALKELDRQRFPTYKFLRELRFLISLEHPNIVTCHALEHIDDRRCLVMDYCEGGTLRSLMPEETFLHPVHCLRLVADVLAGLAHAHSREIVHCDIKPENILLALHAEGWTARVSDFGIARFNQDLAQETSNTGSPAYMAPERFYGQYSYASDLYSVGILLFELLAGHRPFAGSPAELMSAHLNQPVKLSDAIPSEVQSIVLTALQKLPGRRFRSTAAMLAAIQTAEQELRSQLQVGAEQPSLQPRATMPLLPCHSVFQEPLAAEAQQLIGLVAESSSSTSSAINRLYRVCGGDVGCQTYSGAELATAAFRSPFTTVPLPEQVRSLTVLLQGCYAVTQQSVYWIPGTLFEPGTMQHGQKRLQQGTGEKRSHLVPQLIAEFNDHFAVAIAAQRHWMATITTTPDASTSVLSLWRLPQMQRIKTLTHKSMGQVFELLAIDSNHAALISHLSDAGQTCITGVQFSFFTRRGNPIGTFKLDVPLRHVLPGSTPYQLMALEPNFSSSLLLIDLKPFRMVRFGVDIVPILMTSTRWGYVLMAEDGEIVLLDRCGQIMGRIAAPAHPTAIAMIEPATLLVATWWKKQGQLHTIDLRQLTLDILF